MVYIDEAGLDNRLYRPYARAPRGVKVYAKVYGRKTQRVSMIGGWLKDKFIAPLSFMGGCNKEVFNAYLEQVLLPELSKGTTIILDNAAFHKSVRTKEIVEQAGCYLKFLPPYSPDLNPIEHCWHTIKSMLRPILQDTYDNLQQILDHALIQLASTRKN